MSPALCSRKPFWYVDRKTVAHERGENARLFLARRSRDTSSRASRTARPPSTAPRRCRRACCVRAMSAESIFGTIRICCAFDLADLHAIDANDVKAVRRLEHRARLARARAAPERSAEQPALELRHLVAATHPAEITAGVLRLQVHRLALGEPLEIGAGLSCASSDSAFTRATSFAAAVGRGAMTICLNVTVAGLGPRNGFARSNSAAICWSVTFTGTILPSCLSLRSTFVVHAAGGETAPSGTCDTPPAFRAPPFVSAARNSVSVGKLRPRVS